MTTSQSRQALLETNLHLLRARYPDYGQLLAVAPDSSCYFVERTAQGVLCREREGSWIHGPEDPWPEALREAKLLADEGPQLYVVLRPGAGYQALALVDEVSSRDDGSVVLIVEDRLELLRAGLEHLDWTGALTSPSAIVLLGNPFSTVEAYLARHPSLRWLPMTMIAPPSLATDPRCAALGERFSEATDQFRDHAELQLGSASVVLSERRRRRDPLRVMLAGREVGYLTHPLTAAFRACGCDVVHYANTDGVPRGVRASDSFAAILQHLPDVVLWINRPELSQMAAQASRALGITNVLWSVDSTRRVGLEAGDLRAVDVHLSFDDRYLDSSVATHSHLSLGAGVSPLPKCGPTDPCWPAREGPDICFVGALGERRLREFRSTIERRSADELKLLDRLALENADPHVAFERSTGRPYKGLPCGYVDELRTKRRRRALLEAFPRDLLRIFGDPEWGDESAFADCYAGRTAHYGFDLASLYFHAKININIFHEQCVNSTNSRIYDVLAAGGFLLTEARPILKEEFDVERHFATFSTPAEAREKAEYYLTHDAEREAVARAGQRYVLEHHTLERRCRRLFQLVGKG